MAGKNAANAGAAEKVKGSTTKEQEIILVKILIRQSPLSL